MDCWIGVALERDRCVVHLAGRLTAAQVPDLLRACQNCRGVDLNLADLLSADPAGVDALRQLRRTGATLIGANGYIQLKLDSPPLETGG